jgi:hypothetical protein
MGIDQMISSAYPYSKYLPNSIGLVNSKMEDGCAKISPFWGLPHLERYENARIWVSKKPTRADLPFNRPENFMAIKL